MEEKLTNLSNDEIKIKLIHYLGTSNRNHIIEIMKQLNIKLAHIYCILEQLPGQVT